MCRAASVLSEKEMAREAVFGGCKRDNGEEGGKKYRATERRICHGGRFNPRARRQTRMFFLACKHESFSIDEMRVFLRLVLIILFSFSCSVRAAALTFVLCGS